MKAATVICQQIFSILALVIFLLEILLKSPSKIVFFSLWRRDPVLELQFPTPLRVGLLRFATESSADRIVMAASRLPSCYGCIRNTIVFLQLDFVNRIGVAVCATVICQQNFLHFGVSDLLSKNICNKCFKIVLHNNNTWLDDKESDDAVSPAGHLPVYLGSCAVLSTRVC